MEALFTRASSKMQVSTFTLILLQLNRTPFLNLQLNIRLQGAPSKANLCLRISNSKNTLFYLICLKNISSLFILPSVMLFFRRNMIQERKNWAWAKMKFSSDCRKNQKRKNLKAPWKTTVKYKNFSLAFDPQKWSFTFINLKSSSLNFSYTSSTYHFLSIFEKCWWHMNL